MLEITESTSPAHAEAGRWEAETLGPVLQKTPAIMEIKSIA